MPVLHSLIDFLDSQPSNSSAFVTCSKILENLDQIRVMSIEESASLCVTSPASLSRLIKQLGFRGYADFRTQLDRELSNYYYANRVMPDIPDGTYVPGEKYLDCFESSLKSFRSQLNLEAFPTIAK